MPDHDRSPGELTTCHACGHARVSPTDWMSCGEGLWVILLRCGDCETTRIAVAGLEAVERLDDDLEDAAREIAALADALERERVHAETEAFIDSLRRGLLNADDFREESGERADGR